MQEQPSKSSKEIRHAAKETFGFHSLKEMNAEMDAWIDYLYGEPKLHAEVEKRHLAACR